MNSDSYSAKKICLIIHALSPGGMERVMSQIATYFSQKEQWDIHLILYGIKRDVFYPIPDAVVTHRPDFEFLSSRRTWHTVKTLLFLRKTVQKIRPDTILSFGEVWNNMVLLAMLGLRFPIYVSDRSQPGKNLGKVHNRLKQWLYPKATGLIVQTEKAKEIAELTKTNTNIRVIGNPIRDVKPAFDIPKENIVLTVGRLIRTKHIDQLIKIFVHINMSDWRLVIVGGDAKKQNLMAELQQFVKDLDAEDKVILAGTQSDVDSYYHKSKVFAFTSSSEGFPNVIGEAMSAALPIISFDCVAGPSEMIRDEENGFLVPLFENTAFEKRLKSLMQDETLRKELGKNARHSIKKFSVESVGEQFYCFVTGRSEKMPPGLNRTSALL